MMMSFRKMLVLSLVAVLLGVGLVYALGLGINPKKAAQTLTVEGVNAEFGLRLILTLDKIVYQLREKVNLTLVLTNISNETVSYEIPELLHRFDFSVYNDTSNLIYQWSGLRPFPEEVERITLNPGESLTSGNYCVWQQTCNNYTVLSHLNFYFNSTQIGSEGIPASAGTYYIVGQTGPMSFPHKSLVIETVPIQITILES